MSVVSKCHKNYESWQNYINVVIDTWIWSEKRIHEKISGYLNKGFKQWYQDLVKISNFSSVWMAYANKQAHNTDSISPFWSSSLPPFREEKLINYCNTVFINWCMAKICILYFLLFLRKCEQKKHGIGHKYSFFSISPVKRTDRWVGKEVGTDWWDSMFLKILVQNNLRSSSQTN